MGGKNSDYNYIIIVLFDVDNVIDVVRCYKEFLSIQK